MKIGNRGIGPNEPPLIIAEIGINHNGNMNIAKKNSTTKVVHGGNQSTGGDYKNGFFLSLIHI